MRNDTSVEERRGANTLGPVDDLGREDECAWGDVFAEGADGGEGEDGEDAEGFEGGDVGASGDVRGGDAVAYAVAGEEGDEGAGGEGCDGYGGGGVAPGGFGVNVLDESQVVKVVETTASNDTDKYFL